MRSAIIAPAIVPGIAIVLAAVPAAAGAQAGSPIARIADYDKHVNTIETSGADLKARTARFVPIVQANYDMPAIAALVVGPAWAKASAADRSSAITALTRHSAASLAKNFKGPTATTFAVAPKLIDRAGTKVVQVKAGDDTLFYRMGASGRIVDVISGGVSNLSLQRADLADTIASGGVPAMVRKLAEIDGAG